jgi:hypothetical protein
MGFTDSMTSTHPKQTNSSETPNTEFWAKCRQQALELNIPAWLIAEQSFVHGSLDERAGAR